MTDEERAEEYAKGKAHEHYHFLFEENNGSPIDFAKLCHLDGLVEGRKLGKEEQWLATEKGQKKTSARIKELEEIVAEQKAHCKAVDEVNVKLRCCGNCMNRELNKDDISYPCCDCKHWRRNKSNDYWEMGK